MYVLIMLVPFPFDILPKPTVQSSDICPNMSHAHSHIHRANLPTFAEISASVLADEAWVQGEQESVDLVRELVSINQSEANLLVLTNQVTASISAASSSRVSIEFIEFRQRKRLLSDV